MKAAIVRALDGLDALQIEDMTDPVAGPGEVIVAVSACGVNFADSLIIKGKYQVKPELPFSPGAEIAGVVESVGEGCTRLAVGDRVMGMCGYGGYAEKCRIREDICTVIPDEMPFDVAASFPVAFSTSHIALWHKARLQPGETLLVHGAAGGVGLTAVQIGKLMGARVIAGASSDEKLGIAKAAGADDLLNYEKDDIRTTVKAMTNGRGADVIYDPIGGDVFDASLRCINFEGRILPIGFAGGRIPEAPANIVMVKSIDILGINIGNYPTLRPDIMRQSFEQMISWYLESKFKPEITDHWTLDQAKQAIETIAGRKALGKMVITIQ